MREDMDKVIVERPRRGGSWQGDGRAWRNSKEAGSHLGMKRGYHRTKWLNENLAPLEEASHVELFVHPLTGILLPNRRLREARAAQKARLGTWAERRGDTPYAVYHVIDETTQWHRIDGCWFEITLAKFPQRACATQVEEKRYDVLRRCLVTRSGAAQRPAPGMPSHCGMYGRNDVYAAAKRQLSRREVRARLGDGA
jgi:hypothetical protein